MSKEIAKNPTPETRRALVGRLVSEGYRSSRSIAEALKEKHAISVHHSTVARDLEQLGSESERIASGEDSPGMIDRYDARVRDLSEMLEDPDLSKREKLAVHRTLNETEGKLLALRNKAEEEKSGQSGRTEEQRLAWNAARFRILEERHAEYREKLKAELRIEILNELQGGEIAR